MCCSGSCGSSKSGSGLSDPSSPRWCRVARRAHVLCHGEGSLVHAEWLEDAFGEHLAEPPASYLFDYLADPIDVLTVLPALARIEQAYRAQRCHGTRDNARDVHFLAVAQEILVEEVIAEARGMQHKLTHRDVGVGGALLRFAVRVETFEYLDICNLRHVLLCRVVEGDLALLDELHHHHTRHGLRTREDGEHGVCSHLLVLAKLALTGSAFVDVTLTVGHHSDHAGNAVFLLDDTVQHAISGFPDCVFEGFSFPANHFLVPYGLTL